MGMIEVTDDPAALQQFQLHDQLPHTTDALGIEHRHRSISKAHGGDLQCGFVFHRAYFPCSGRPHALVTLVATASMPARSKAASWVMRPESRTTRRLAFTMLERSFSALRLANSPAAAPVLAMVHRLALSGPSSIFQTAMVLG